MKDMKGCGPMIDNQKPAVSRQKGIERVIQKGPQQMGQGGKMHSGSGSAKNFKRSGDSLTPRKA